MADLMDVIFQKLPSQTKLDFNSDSLRQQLTLTCDTLRSVFYSAIQYSAVILLIVIIVLVLYLAYKAYLSPVNYSKNLTDIGFDHIQGRDRFLSIARTQANRRIGSKIPPPYPNGWFAVCESGDVGVGGVKPVDVLGQNLVIYRGTDSIARCVDAYCPHLGANLGVGGVVHGSCIECPFHKWQFDAEGRCKSVPDNDSPKGVTIRTWPTVEADRAIWIWHDAEGRPPLWEMTDAQESIEWGYRGRNEFTVGCHIQEIPENGADVAHLNAVHSVSLLSGLAEKYPALHHIIGCHLWNAQWSKVDESHTAVMTLTHDYRIMKMNLLHLELNILQNGPSHVRLRINSIAGPILISQSVTPVGPLQQRIVNRIFTPSYNAVAGALTIWGEGLMLERDIAIWNNKCFVGAPAYVKTDKTIRAFRTWYSQFYSENSISFRDANRNPLDW